MSGWKRVVRGMAGMGLVFAAGTGLVLSALASVGLVVRGGDGWREIAIHVVNGTFGGFLMGMLFGGVMALTARGRSFESLSLPRFAVLGVGVGLFFYAPLALNAWEVWSVADAVFSALLFVVMGGGSATASLIVARKAESALGSGGDAEMLAATSGLREPGVVNPWSSGRKRFRVEEDRLRKGG